MHEHSTQTYAEAGRAEVDAKPNIERRLENVEAELTRVEDWWKRVRGQLEPIMRKPDEKDPVPMDEDTPFSRESSLARYLAGCEDRLLNLRESMSDVFDRLEI